MRASCGTLLFCLPTTTQTGQRSSPSLFGSSAKHTLRKTYARKLFAIATIALASFWLLENALLFAGANNDFHLTPRGIYASFFCQAAFLDEDIVCHCFHVNFSKSREIRTRTAFIYSYFCSRSLDALVPVRFTVVCCVPAFPRSSRRVYRNSLYSSSRCYPVRLAND